FLLSTPPPPCSPLFPYTTLFRSLRPLARRRLSVVSLHIWSGCVDVHPRQDCRAYHAQYGSARQVNPSRALRARARWSAPANCVPRLECRQSLPGHSSTALLPLCARQNSASSACASSPARTHRAVAGNRSTPVTSISPRPSGVLFESTD